VPWMAKLGGLKWNYRLSGSPGFNELQLNLRRNGR
jgi:hypothetical protein